MPTPAERKALMFVAAAALLGTAVRAARTYTAAAPVSQQSRATLSHQIAAVEAARKTPAKSSSGASPASSGKLVDVDMASEAQLQTLPRVGPVLAKRIKAFRDSAGAFGSLEQLDKVKGIGPALLKELAPRVTFSTSQRPRNAPSF